MHPPKAQTMIRIALAAALVLTIAPLAAACEISLNCATGKAIINGKTYPIVCGHQTGRGVEFWLDRQLDSRQRPWRPGPCRAGHADGHDASATVL